MTVPNARRRPPAAFVPFVLIAGLLALPLAGMAATTSEVSGLELVINTNTESQVHNPVAAFNAQGQTMVVWENDLLGLRGRLYGAGGTPLSGEVALVANAAWSALPGSAPVVFHLDPAILFLPSGDFLVAWAQEKGNLEWTIFFENLQVKSQEIMVQRFNSTGVASGPAYMVSVPGPALKDNPELALLPGGAGVLVTWAGGLVSPAVAGQAGVYTRLLSESGEPVADQVEVDQTPDGWAASLPALSVAADGGYLVAWDSQQISNSFNTSVLARAYAATGAAVADAFSVSGSLAGPQMRPSIAPDGKGLYLLAYQSYYQDIWHAHVLGQVIDETGSLVATATQISTGANGLAEVAPTIVPAGGGTFAVVWMEFDTWFPNGMAGVHVDKTGTPIDSEVWINNAQINSQFRTNLATDGAGHWIAPYEAFTNDTTVGILARFF